ncbi:AraC family transcriptional regulator [Aquimarina mytili]|uniref:Helix-turn-helix domain-containing protein n=1 Tax=Aquimarina mytili TaxID=874423 RepID=A0A936ZRF5_9FLAO|nr:AraC family transcriptional regulator [Aquimarina mytili]MBL0683343.1 helix-turn-helix domain-containing protein [Aquimarina mytili]
MKMSYEQIYLEQSKSLKIETYTYDSLCNTINWHIHPEYEIVYIKNGSGKIQLDRYSQEYTDGCIIFLGPNIPHMPFGNKEFKTNVEVVIQFPEAFVTEKLIHFPEFASMMKFIQKSTQGIIFSSETHKKLSAAFLKFRNQNNTEKLLNFSQLLYQLSISEGQKLILKNNHSLEINKHSLERIAKVYQYINKNYNKEIRSESIANSLGLTPNSFCRMFKSSTNRSFINFLNEFRIRKAQEHFENDKHVTVSEVMYQCGFNDPSYFSRQFKKYLGVSPSDYNKQ